ncbi:hypothetical protein B0H13DRAFT_1903419 [Mycena leptocephala]|nr:hypothetical protein B0H13DRAFT_1903419 [Mycena leptocephala]
MPITAEKPVDSSGHITGRGFCLPAASALYDIMIATRPASSSLALLPSFFQTPALSRPVERCRATARWSTQAAFRHNTGRKCYKIMVLPIRKYNNTGNHKCSTLLWKIVVTAQPRTPFPQIADMRPRSSMAPFHMPKFRARRRARTDRGGGGRSGERMSPKEKRARGGKKREITHTLVDKLGLGLGLEEGWGECASREMWRYVVLQEKGWGFSFCFGVGSFSQSESKQPEAQKARSSRNEAEQLLRGNWDWPLLRVVPGSAAGPMQSYAPMRWKSRTGSEAKEKNRGHGAVSSVKEQRLGQALIGKKIPSRSLRQETEKRARERESERSEEE